MSLPKDKFDYISGFLAKCAECNVKKDVVLGMLKQALGTFDYGDMLWLHPEWEHHVPEPKYVPPPPPPRPKIFDPRPKNRRFGIWPGHSKEDILAKAKAISRAKTRMRVMETLKSTLSPKSYLGKGQIKSLAPALLRLLAHR